MMMVMMMDDDVDDDDEEEEEEDSRKGWWVMRWPDDNEGDVRIVFFYKDFLPEVSTQASFFIFQKKQLPSEIVRNFSEASVFKQFPHSWWFNFRNTSFLIGKKVVIFHIHL